MYLRSDGSQWEQLGAASRFSANEPLDGVERVQYGPNISLRCQQPILGALAAARAKVMSSRDRRRTAVTTEKVGLIGLGRMGLPMGERLLAAGHSLVVLPHHRREPAEALAARGARSASSLRELARESEVVITMLPTSADVERVLLGDGGVLSTLREGARAIDMSTVAPAVARKVHEALAARGVGCLDAPVSGGPVRAANGTLTIMVGGDAAVLERCRPVLSALGNRIVHVGGPGAGQVVKLCNNLLGAVIMLANAEALTLGVKAGVDATTLRDVIVSATGANYLLENAIPQNILQDRYEAGFALDLMLKDVDLAVELGRDVRAPTMAASLAQQMYRVVSGLGYGGADFSAVSTLYQDSAGITVATGDARLRRDQGARN